MNFHQMRLHKNVLQSKTIWGLLVAAAVTVVKDQGYHIDYEILDPELQAAARNLIQLVGFVLIAYGRVSASKKLSV